MTRAALTPELLEWAIGRRGVTVDEVAGKIRVAVQRVEQWLAGASKPTLKQATDLARILRVPLGYLFLKEPPAFKVPIPDYRTVTDRAIGEPSADLREVLNDALRKQDWYRNYLISEGAQRLDFVSRFAVSDPVEVVAQDIREKVGIDAELRRRAGSWSGYLTRLSQATQAAGVLLLRSGVVKNNTSRPLSADEFRGFTVVDDYAPLIFVNSADFVVARIFTLAHELAHVWLGKSGISNSHSEEATAQLVSNSDLERFCNAVAAEVLVPADELVGTWRRALPATKQFEQLARSFRVSAIVVLRRALDLDLIDKPQFLTALIRSRESSTSRKASAGGDGINNLLARNGQLLTTAVIASALEGQLLLRDAASLLGTQVPTLRNTAARLGLE